MDMAEAAPDSARQENIERILEAAERLFRHYGYNKTTVADIARELGMSPANVYRFFASKEQIHQAICGRMLAASLELNRSIAALPLGATERLRRCVLTQHKLTVETMLDEQDWHVIDKYIDQLHLIYADLIEEGIGTGEFARQDAASAARCFGAALVTLCHPQQVAQCLMKENRATAEQLVDFAIEALK
jgi:AcrR family transcriptional regulator